MTARFVLLQFLLSMTAAACAVAVGRVFVRRHCGKTAQQIIKGSHHLHLAILLLILKPAGTALLSSDPSASWDLPDLVQLHFDELHFGLVSVLVGYILGFCSCMAFSQQHGSRWTTLMLGVTAIFAVQGVAWFQLSSGRLRLTEARVSTDGATLQSSNSSCAPAAAANIAGILGIRTTEADLARRFHTTKDGTFPAQVLAGLRELDILGRKVSVATADLTKVNPPAMLFLVSDGHAVAFAGITNGLAEILDPACGRRRMDPASLRDVWQGHALEFWRAR